MKYFVFGFFFLFLAVLTPLSAHATKKCPVVSCSENLELCAEKSIWIAEGTLHDVQRNWKGKPLNKDFASFVFRIDEWVKLPPQLSPVPEVSFQVGWCKNGQALPNVTEGRFRFYGENDVLEKGRRQIPLYLYFEKISDE